MSSGKSDEEKARYWQRTVSAARVTSHPARDRARQGTPRRACTTLRGADGDAQNKRSGTHAPAPLTRTPGKSACPPPRASSSRETDCFAVVENTGVTPTSGHALRRVTPHFRA